MRRTRAEVSPVAFKAFGAAADRGSMGRELIRRRGRRITLTAVLAALIAAAGPPSASASPLDAFPGQTVDPSGSWADFGPNFGFGAEANENDHDGNPGTPNNSAWYSWTPDANRTVTIDTCAASENGLDTFLAVYTGNTFPLTPLAGAADDDSCGIRSKTKFDGAAGTTYRIAVDGKGNAGTLAFAMVPTPANDDRADAATLPAAGTVETSNDGATKEAGEASHAGQNGGTSLWYLWQAPATGTTTFQTCGSNIDTLLGIYTAAGAPVLSDDNGCGGSGSLARFSATSGTTYAIAVDGKANALYRGGEEGAFRLDFSMAPANDAFADAETIPPAPLPQSKTGNNVGASFETGEAHTGGYGRTIWYSWTPTAAGTVSFNTCDTDDDVVTAVDVYTGTAPPFTGLTRLAGDSSGCANGFQGKATAQVLAGTTYSIAVSSPVGGPVELDLATGTTTPPVTPPVTPPTQTTPLPTVTTPVVTPPPAAKKKCKGKKAKRSKRCRKKR
jgi:hypothetical protein